MKRSPCMMLCLLPTYLIYASEDNEALFSLTLEQLMDVQISVVSNRKETIREAPAIVGRLERAEMEQLGLRSLRDILSFFPGFVLNTDPTSTSPVMVRGLYDPDNQKILFLLDETPYWMSATGNIPLLGIPVSAIESVEVIRGPGGVIYGTNASAGVIKVVTRKDKNTDVSLLLGDNDLLIGNGYGQFQLPDGTLTMAFEGRNDSGYQAQGKNFFDTSTRSFSIGGKIKRAQTHLSTLVKYHNAGFALTAEAFQSTDTGITNAQLMESHVREDTGYLLAGHYTFGNNQWQYKIYADGNRYYYHTDVDNLITATSIGNAIDPPVIGDGNFGFDHNGHNNYLWRIGAGASGQLLENLHLDIGIENERRSTEAFRITDEVDGAAYSAIFGTPSLTLYNGGNVSELSAFAQLDYRQDAWRFILGTRYTDNKDYGGKITPKASLIYQFNDKQSLKLLFSEGFNSPTLAQNRISDEFRNDIVLDLDAETIQSSDIAYTYSDSRHNFVTNIFYVEAKDLITRKFRAGFVNADNVVRRHGIEFDYKYASKQWQLYANLHYLDQGNKEVVNDPSAAIAPSITASLGLNYTLGQHQFGFSDRFVGERADAGSYQLLNLSYSWSQGPFKIFVDVLNVLDDNALQHNNKFLDFPIYMASEQGTTMQLGFKYRFGG